MVEIAALLPWLSAATALLALATTLWSILSSPARKAADRVTAAEVRLATLEREQLILSARVDGVPTREALHGLEMSLARLEAQMGRIDERLKPISATMERMQDALLHKE